MLVLLLLVGVIAVAGFWLWQDRSPWRELADPIYHLSGARYVRTQCAYDLPDRAHVECGYLYPSTKLHADKELRLPVVIFRSQRPEGPPLLFLQGGPGAPARLDPDQILETWAWYAGLVSGRDIVLYDVRGVGRSEPALDCRDTERFLRLYSRALTAREEAQALLDLDKDCRDLLVREGFLLESLRLEVLTNDTLELMALVHDGRWDLYGASYGTRLALDVMRQAPNKIRVAVLDSVLPPPADVNEEIPKILQASLDLLIDGCTRHPHCPYTPEEFPGTLEKTLARLRADPPQLQLEHPDRDEPIDFWLTDHRLVSAIAHTAPYDLLMTETIAAKLDSLHEPEVAEELLSWIAPYWLDLELVYPLYVSVYCNDEPLLSKEELRSQVRQYPRVAAYLLPSVDFNVCEVWHGAAENRRQKEKALPDIPTLILAGTFDTITPPEWARDVAASLPRRFLFEFPSAHGVIGRDSCPDEVLRSFLSRPEHRPAPPCLSGN